MIDFATIETALLKVLKASIGEAILADQASPRPARPYATLKLIGPVALGMDELRISTDLGQPAGEEVELASVGQRTMVASCQVFAKETRGNNSARALLSKVQSRLSLPSVREALNAAGMGVLSVGGILDLTGVLETEPEGRASMDITLHVVDVETERTTFIETVETTDLVTA